VSCAREAKSPVYDGFVAIIVICVRKTEDANDDATAEKAETDDGGK